MKLFRGCAWFLAAAVAVGVVVPQASAGTRRHDKLDSDFVNLAKQWPYQTVGLLEFGGALASGVLVSRQWVVTAAHCVDTHPAGMTFNLNGTLYEAETWFPHPNWTGDVAAGWDIGLVKLKTAVPSTIEPVRRYRGQSELGKEGTTVGFGRTGTGMTGDTQDAGTKRAGRNIIDVLGTAQGYSDRILMADFDRPGYPQESSWGSTAPVAMEYSPARGDSGGGLFIQDGGYWQVCGLTSFGEAGPANAPHDDGPNAAYGDLMGWTRVSSFNDWIDSFIPNYWKGAGTPLAFSTPAHWSNGVAPDAAQFPVFDLPAAITVTFSQDVTNRRVEVQRGTYTFDLGGHTYTLTEGPTVVAPETGQSAKCIVSGGTLHTCQTFIGRKTSSVGAVETVNGGVWHDGGSVYVGGDQAGPGGSGSLLINPGTALDIDGTLRIYAVGGTGQVAIRGQADVDTLDIGGITTPTMTVGSGGTLTVVNAFVARRAGDKATLTLSAGTMNVLGYMYVGGSATAAGGNGTLQIADGAALNVDGLLKVWQGTGAFSNAGTLTVGECSTFAAGGTVSQLAGNTLTGGTWNVGVGGRLDFPAGAVITVNQGAVTLRGPGSMLAALDGLAENRGSLSLLEGRTFATVGGLANSGALTIGPASRLTVNGRYVQSAGVTTIEGEFRAARGTVRIDGGDLAFAGDGFLDLTTRAMVFDYGEAGSPIAQVAGLIRSGYNAAAGGAWDGPGIRSADAATQPDGLTAVGVLPNTDEKVGGKTAFEGEAVDATAVLARYTWWGDANLDGVVDANDYDVIDKYFLFTPDPDNTGWWTGDFTYDGRVDANDYDRIDKAFLFQTGPLGGGDDGVAASLTPEPATVILVAAGVVGLWGSRRRRA